MNPEPLQTPKRCGNDAAVETLENQTTVFHRSHRPLEIAAAIPTFPQRRRRESLIPIRSLAPFGRWRSKLTKYANERRHLAAVRRGRATLIISGSSRIGIEVSFQAHLALESIFDFRLICGLENAAGSAENSG